MNNYCSICCEDLIEGIDQDPNGDMKAKCVRCETEEDIDFDLFPNAVVSRHGHVEGTDN